MLRAVPDDAPKRTFPRYPNMPTAEDNRRYAEQRRARMVQIARHLSQVGPRFEQRTFASFDATAENTAALAAARAASSSRSGLGLFGPAGVGKSHLAAAMVNASVARGDGAIYTGVVDVLARIKAAFKTGGDEGIIDRLCDMPLLVLDDLAKEQLTEWSAATLYRIVNRRYEAALPIVVTANRSLDDLVATRCARLPDGVDSHTVIATYDRIAEMTGPWIEVAGTSRRRRDLD